MPKVKTTWLSATPMRTDSVIEGIERTSWKMLPPTMARNASPTAWAEVAQAVTTGRVGPFALWRIAMLPEAMLGIIIAIM